MPVYYNHEQDYQRRLKEGKKSWDDLTQNRSDPFNRLKTFLSSKYCPKQGTTLDLGCGGGQASFMLAGNGFTVIGIDFAPSAIELANNNLMV